DLEYFFQIVKAGAVEGGAGEGGAACFGRTVGGGEVAVVVFLEVGVEGNVEESAVTAGEDFWGAGDGFVHEFVVFNDAQASGALCDEDVAVGEEGHAPGMFEACGYGGYFPSVGFRDGGGGFDGLGGGGQGCKAEECREKEGGGNF